MSAALDPRRVGLSLVFFGLAFTASSNALRPLLAGQASNLTETKLEWFAENGARFDTLFFGSSRAYRGFVPEDFDRYTAELGVATRSFNFGSPASRVFDAYRMLERLEQRGALDQVEWVLVDPEPLDWLLRAKDKESMLARGPIDWHDPRTTWLVLRYIWSLEGAGPLERLAASIEHLHSCCYFVAGIGGTESLVNRLLGRPSRDYILIEDRLGPRLDGWLPLDDVNLTREEHREKFRGAERQEVYLSDLAARRAETVDDRPCKAAASVFFTRLAAKIEALGATPVFVTQPALNLQVDLVKAHRQGLVEHLLRYDDPDDPRTAPLFEVENRWDKFHLAESGARIFTEMLARDFAELAARAGQQP
jgi:hypothetical protein